MKTAMQLQALLNLPEFKKLFIGAKQGLELMKECMKHNLFDELVMVEDMVGFEKGYLAKEIGFYEKYQQLAIRQRMQIL